MSKLRRIPFDHLALEAIIREIREEIGSKVQEIRQRERSEFTLGLYRRELRHLYVSIAPEWARVHFVENALPKRGEAPSAFLSTLRSRLVGARLAEVEQIPAERIFRLSFAREDETHHMWIEVMGKHSNAILVNADGVIVKALKDVPPSKTQRPIRGGLKYELPPVLRSSPQPSPFMRQLGISTLNRVTPVQCAGYGAYPVSVASIGYEETSAPTLSVALENTWATLETSSELDRTRSRLMSLLERKLASHAVSHSNITHALTEGGRAGVWQRRAELLLARHPTLPASGIVEIEDWDGQLLRFPIDPELSTVENANAIFQKAKHAKQALPELQKAQHHLESEIRDIEAALISVELATKLSELEPIEKEALSRKWVQEQKIQGPKGDAERPYDGHRIREILGPGGVIVLYGENATSNDFLTLKVARPNDFWLHVRGATSAHVILRTGNQPQRIQPHQIQFAAEIAVRNSSQKHAKYVPVDYTLKKYVRKPKGSPAGSVSYSQENTIFVDLP